MLLLPPKRRALRAASLALALGCVTLAEAPLAHAQTPSSSAPAAKKKKADKKTDKKTDTTEGEQQPAPAPAPAAEEPPKEDPTKKFTEEESKRAIYFSGDLGFTRPDLGGISDNTGFDRTAANGFLYGLAAGLRLKDIRFGARWRVYDTTEFTLWSFAASVGYGLPLRPLSPILSAHIGYVFDQLIEEALFKSSLPQGTILPPDVNMRGLLTGLDLNASYWFTKFLRLGAFVGVDFMFLHRDQAPYPGTLFGVPAETRQNPLFSDSGSSIALVFNLGFRGAFDIGF